MLRSERVHTHLFIGCCISWLPNKLLWIEKHPYLFLIFIIILLISSIHNWGVDKLLHFYAFVFTLSTWHPSATTVLLCLLLPVLREETIGLLLLTIQSRASHFPHFLKFLCSPGVSLIDLTMLNYCEFFRCLKLFLLSPRGGQSLTLKSQCPRL